MAVNVPGSTSSIQLISSDPQPTSPPPPPRISLSEILSDVSVKRQQEAADKAKFTPILFPNLDDIRTKLIAWAATNFQGSCDLVRIPLAIPNVCSDGVARPYFDYIQFVSGKTVVEHLQVLQPILPEFEVGYRSAPTELVFCVTKVTG